MLLANMNQEQRERIDSCYQVIVPRININKLWPKLLDNKVYNTDDANISRWKKNFANNETIGDIYSTIKTRGPFAFDRFLASLRQSDHEDLADILQGNNTVLSNDDIPRIPPIQEIQENEFFRNIQQAEVPLQIQVQKSTTFLDGPVYKNVQRYPMRSNPRGLVLLITNIEFQDSDKEPRNSAIHDKQNLEQLFEQMGFRVVSHRNLTKRVLLEKIKELSQCQELRKVDSCFIIISSHGNINSQYEVTEIECVSDNLQNKAQNDKTILCTDILDHFTAEACPHLAGKPKIFIFQLCRGEKKQKSVKEPRHTTDVSNLHSVDETINLIVDDKKTMRNYADMLVAHATLPGHVAFRDKITGSWFIQILCEVFMKYAHETHLQDLLNMVDERLKIQRTTREECQTLMITSIGFNKHCYLNPGLFEQP